MKLLRGWLGVAILTVLVSAMLLGGYWFVTTNLAGLLMLRGDAMPVQIRVEGQQLDFRGPGTEHTRPFSTTVPAGTARALRLASVTGRVTIESAGDTGQVEVTAVKRAWGTAAQARQVFETLQVQVEARDDAIVVTTEPRLHWPKYSSVDYRVRVPRGFVVTVEAVTSRVAVRGVFDSVTVRVTTGTVDLDLEEVIRQVSVDLVTGTITAGFTPVRGGNYELAVITGTVAAEVPAASGIDAILSVTTGRISPGSGPWELRASHGQRFEGTAAGGGARLTMTAVTGMVALVRR
jgi:hypothetical protein